MSECKDGTTVVRYSYRLFSNIHSYATHTWSPIPSQFGCTLRACWTGLVVRGVSYKDTCRIRELISIVFITMALSCLGKMRMLSCDGMVSSIDVSPRTKLMV
jgi:hypothetical protein